ncbi:hypothetical protein [Dactylosporangium sp. NPDC006015]|uniref:hypothetical protein n=1 Tax=Dactylosporangium sp. NPDC006015 TaxID=3154576 RepID=UPI0033A2F330
MSNTKEKPIPEDAPGRLIAEYLRLVRRLVGGPAYRTLATLAFVKQNALSQHASGQRVIQWDSMRLYVEAVQRYADQHAIDLQAAMRQHAEEVGVDPDSDILTQARVVYDRNVAQHAAKTAARRVPSAELASVGQTDERSVLVDEVVVASIPGPTPPETLFSANTLHEIVGALNDQIIQLGWDLSARTWDVHRVGVPPYLLDREALDALTGRVALTDRVFALILHACGAGTFDEQTFHPHDKEWTLGWQRATSNPEPQQEQPLEDAGAAGIPMTEVVDPDRKQGWWAVVRSWPRWRLTRWQWRRRVDAAAAAQPNRVPLAPAQRPGGHDSEQGVSGRSRNNLEVS